MYAAVDNHVLADTVVVSDFHKRIFTFPTEVLRGGGNHTTVVESVVFTDSCTRADAYVQADHTSLSDFHIVINICECIDCDVISNFGVGMNKRQRARSET